MTIVYLVVAVISIITVFAVLDETITSHRKSHEVALFPIGLDIASAVGADVLAVLAGKGIFGMSDMAPALFLWIVMMLIGGTAGWVWYDVEKKVSDTPWIRINIVINTIVIVIAMSIG